MKDKRYIGIEDMNGKKIYEGDVVIYYFLLGGELDAKAVWNEEKEMFVFKSLYNSASFFYDGIGKNVRLINEEELI